jgi:hypothetical protein
VAPSAAEKRSPGWFRRRVSGFVCSNPELKKFRTQSWEAKTKKNALYSGVQPRIARVHADRTNTNSLPAFRNSHPADAQRQFTMNRSLSLCYNRAVKRRTLLVAAPLALLAPGAMAKAMNFAFDSVAHENFPATEKEQNSGMATSTAVYELRIYHVPPGKIDELVARFRDHTMKLFSNHGIKSVAYWTALDEPAKSSTFFYILEHPSREAAAANWKAFQNDPEWQKVKATSEANGKLVEKIDSTFLTLADFSPRLG